MTNTTLDIIARRQKHYLRLDVLHSAFVAAFVALSLGAFF